MRDLPFESLRLLLADDHDLFREAMAVWLQRLNYKVIVDHADSMNRALQLLGSNHAYHLTMIDLHMPGMNGISSLNRLCALAAPAPMVIVSADESPITIQNCMATNIAGYIPKSFAGEAVLNALKSILNGKHYIPPGIDLVHQPKWSNKQLQLLACLVEGISNRDIAKRLHLSEGTVKQYVSIILEELNVANRTQAAIKAHAILGVSADL